MAILTDAEVAAFEEDVREVIYDDTIATTITYRQTGTTVSTWDPTSGVIPAMYTESTVSAFKGSYSLEEIEQSGGLLEFRDVKFIIMGDDVSGILTIDDMVRETTSEQQSATTYQIKAINRDPLNIAYFVRVRRLLNRDL